VAEICERTQGKAGVAMKGKVITHRELAARWSYAEITGRFASKYATNHQDPQSVALINKINNGISFGDLDQAERDQLANWFDTGYRRDCAKVFNAWYVSFRVESWTKSQLAAVYTLPINDPLGQGRSLTFGDYIAHARRRLPNGHVDIRDAAVAADSVPSATPFIQREPLVIGHRSDGKLALWEGKFRACLFSRVADQDAQILVWVPYEGKWPGRVLGATPRSLEYYIFGML
jgi:hypothetical protein